MKSGACIDVLDEIGQADNTLMFWEIGDNGSSMEGTLNGVFNEMVVAERQPGRHLLRDRAHR